MGRNTSIEWCDSTVNPTSGCDGCELWNRHTGGTCYAATIHTRFAGGNPAYPGPFDEVHLHPGRMYQAAEWPDLTGKRRPKKPWLDGRPRHIFIGDMGDNFSRAVPFQYLADEVIGAVTSEAGQRHVWLWMTKQPGRMLEFAKQLTDQGIAWPDNLMAMTSVTDEATAKGRVPRLLEIPCRWHGLSIEPLLGRIWLLQNWVRGFNWVIIGGESGPAARPCDLGGIHLIIEQCKARTVPVFVKQLGARPVGVPRWEVDTIRDGEETSCFCPSDPNGWPLPIGDVKGSNPAWWPADLRVREMPAVLGAKEPPGPMRMHDVRSQ